MITDPPYSNIEFLLLKRQSSQLSEHLNKVNFFKFIYINFPYKKENNYVKIFGNNEIIFMSSILGSIGTDV